MERFWGVRRAQTVLLRRKFILALRTKKVPTVIGSVYGGAPGDSHTEEMGSESPPGN